MKTFLIAAACFAVAVAGPSRFIIPSPGGPAPVVVEGEYEPISVGPAIIEGDYQPISVGPAIVEGDYEPISVGPAIVEGDYEPISVGPAIVDGEYEPISVGPAIVNPVIPSPANSPLVQITINVNTDSVSPVTVDNAPVIVGPEVDPTPVDFVDNEEVEPSPVIVVDEVEVPEPVLIAPIDTAPVVNVPDILN